MVRAPEDDDEDEDLLYTSARPRAVSNSLRELETEEQETSSSSSSYGKGVLGGKARPKWGAQRTGRAPFGALVAWLDSIDPAALPWNEALPIARAAARLLKPPLADRIESELGDLVLSAAVIASVVRKLGTRWVERAARMTKTRAKESKTGYLTTLLAEGLELAGLCPAGGGYRAFRLLEGAIARHLAWYMARLLDSKTPAQDVRV
jgi:hypothetical protein